MIASLTGRLAFKAPTYLILDVHGVGYEVCIPLSTYYGLPNLSESVSLNVHTHVREDAIQLFGFLTAQEKGAFVLLTSVSGVGPKLALSVLSALPVSDLASAIRSGDVEKLTTVPGIGNKSASRLVLELKDKVEKLHPALAQANELPRQGQDAVFDDALSALVNLGYRPQDAKEALKQVKKSNAESIVLKDMIRESLKELARG
ncbi:MAG: Holliday junction branch migration protein RuvA [Nitrospira sp.]|jgi:holliday junction DNA helicase RuvA|nr:Holliday junction branch migration protein RuvA [Nitrospira sp.]TKB74498.1 MAG: Holliday junction branch migration protein RuvA [Nitrospira sp.]